MNRDLLRARLASLLALLGKIEALASVPQKDFVSEEPRRDLCSWYLVLSIEAASSVAEHLISAAAWGIPENSGQEFELLASKGAITPELAAQLHAAVGLRNILVHQYTDVRWDFVYAAATDLQRLRDFVRQITQHAGL